MPLYTYECEICDELQVAISSVADRHLAPGCKKCGMATRLKITGTHLAPVTRAGTGSSGLTKRARAHIAAHG